MTSLASLDSNVFQNTVLRLIGIQCLARPTIYIAAPNAILRRVEFLGAGFPGYATR